MMSYHFFYLSEIQFSGRTDAYVVWTSTIKKNSNYVDGGFPKQKTLELYHRWNLWMPRVLNADR